MKTMNACNRMKHVLFEIRYRNGNNRELRNDDIGKVYILYEEEDIC